MPLFSSVCGAFGGGVKIRFHQGNDAHLLNSVFHCCNSLISVCIDAMVERAFSMAI